jgi:hypothetical protein
MWRRMGSRGLAPHIHNLVTRRRRVVRFTLRPFSSPWNRPVYPLRLAVCWHRSRFKCGGAVKKSLLCPCQESKPGCPARSLVIILNNLHRQSSTTYLRDEKWIKNSAHKHNGKNHFGDLSVHGTIILKPILKTGPVGLEWFHLTQNMVQFC